MINLTSKQRKILEKLAHNLEPIVIVGANGISDGVVKMVANSLEAHELIKVKFNEFKDEKNELTSQLCNDCNATLVKLIGNVAILFKQADDEEKRKIKI